MGGSLIELVLLVLLLRTKSTGGPVAPYESFSMNQTVIKIGKGKYNIQDFFG
jgi:hypothetical protein